MRATKTARLRSASASCAADLGRSAGIRERVMRCGAAFSAPPSAARRAPALRSARGRQRAAASPGTRRAPRRTRAAASRSVIVHFCMLETCTAPRLASLYIPPRARLGRHSWCAHLRIPISRCSCRNDRPASPGQPAPPLSSGAAGSICHPGAPPFSRAEEPGRDPVNEPVSDPVKDPVDAGAKSPDLCSSGRSVRSLRAASMSKCRRARTHTHTRGGQIGHRALTLQAS